MDKTKWVIYGYRGWIGNMVVEYLRSIHAVIHFGESRLENYEDLFSEIKSIRDNSESHIVVLSFTGRTHGPGFTTIDYLEQPGKLPENLRDNLYGPMNLADICSKMGIHYTYLGTGCIYQFDDQHTIENRLGFVETDLPNFQGSAYSAVKAMTDQLIVRFPNVLVLRIRLPVIGLSHPRSLITKLLGYKKVMTGVPNAISVLPTLIPIMISLIQHGEVGCYNFVNPGSMSHDQILDLYKEMVDPSLRYETFSVEEQNRILACPRSNTCLDTQKLEMYCQRHNLTLLSLQAAIKLVMS